MLQVMTLTTLPIMEDTMPASSWGRPGTRDNVLVASSFLVNILVMILYKVLFAEPCSTFGTTMSLDSVPTCSVDKNFLTY